MQKLKSCVIYYSLSGNTELIAKAISDEIGAKLVKIQPKKEIKSKGLLKYLWVGKQVLMKETPDIDDISEKFDDYDLIIIGTPVWAYTFSPPIRGFFSKVSITNKKIALFCTYDGTKGNALSKMENELLKDKIVGEESFLKVKNNQEGSVEKAKEWVKKLVATI